MNRAAHVVFALSLCISFISVSIFCSGQQSPVQVAAPAIASLNPSVGSVGMVVTIVGSGFGASQGSSTITFNGISAIVNGWSDTSIVASVPAGATTGNVVVAVGDNVSNGIPFQVKASGFGQPIFDLATSMAMDQTIVENILLRVGKTEDWLRLLPKRPPRTDYAIISELVREGQRHGQGITKNRRAPSLRVCCQRTKSAVPRSMPYDNSEV